MSWLNEPALQRLHHDISMEIGCLPHHFSYQGSKESTLTMGVGYYFNLLSLRTDTDVTQ
jgi:hypothetical protein